MEVVQVPGARRQVRHRVVLVELGAALQPGVELAGAGEGLSRPRRAGHGVAVQPHPVEGVGAHDRVVDVADDQPRGPCGRDDDPGRRVVDGHVAVVDRRHLHVVEGPVVGQAVALDLDEPVALVIGGRDGGGVAGAHLQRHARHLLGEEPADHAPDAAVDVFDPGGRPERTVRQDAAPQHHPVAVAVRGVGDQRQPLVPGALVGPDTVHRALRLQGQAVQQVIGCGHGVVLVRRPHPTCLGRHGTTLPGRQASGNAHSLAMQPCSDLVCCCISGANRPSPGQSRWPWPSPCPTSWATT